MKQSVFNFFLIRFRILGINIANTFNIETAYPAENWANIFSTLTFTASYILFLNIIFGNVETLGGYTKNDMLFFVFIGQVAFHTMYTWSYDNVERLIESVHDGEMDVLLTKPLPILFYVCTRSFTLIKLVRDAILPMIMIGLLIDWSQIHINLVQIVAGIIVFVCGQWAVHVLQFMLALPAFWNGQSQALLRIAYTLTSPNLPFEGLTRFWKVFLTTILPICLPTAGAVSVLLGKSNSLYMITWSIAVAILATAIRYFAWQRALRAYNSASS